MLEIGVISFILLIIIASYNCWKKFKIRKLEIHLMNEKLKNKKLLLNKLHELWEDYEATAGILTRNVQLYDEIKTALESSGLDIYTFILRSLLYKLRYAPRYKF